MPNLLVWLGVPPKLRHRSALAERSPWGNICGWRGDIVPKDRGEDVSSDRAAVDGSVLAGQQQQWGTTFAANAGMYGASPSEPAIAAADRFAQHGISDVIELGAGQGRDTLYFARQGFRVRALDYAAGTIETILADAELAGVADRITAEYHDVREPLPFADAGSGACYSHMLFCMALTTPELERLAKEVRRVVRPGGVVVYTARTTADAHYGTGIPRGDNMYEHGGFIVHFFDEQLIDRLASGFDLVESTLFTEGELPRRLVRVTMRVPAG
jgi:SAM-dependent methyltransferase